MSFARSTRGVAHKQKKSRLPKNGLSAYGVAVLNGFSGNEVEWLNSLQVSATVINGGAPDTVYDNATVISGGVP